MTKLDFFREDGIFSIITAGPTCWEQLILPDFNAYRDTKIQLYTLSQHANPILLRLPSLESDIKQSTFNDTDASVIAIHGFRSNDLVKTRFTEGTRYFYFLLLILIRFIQKLKDSSKMALEKRIKR